MATEAWNPKKQLGELTLKLRSQRTGDVLQFPDSGVKVGIVAKGRGNVARERQYAVLGEKDGKPQRLYKRSATEAAVAAQDLHRERMTELTAAQQY